ncbi:MAG: alanine dehydrogenase, partial [Nitrospirales bacterium]
MIIGVPTEIKDQEFRVSMTPDGVQTLCAAGHTVWVQTGAGLGSGFSDDAYRKAGAHVAKDAAQVWQEAEVIVKVKEPMPSECTLFRRGQGVFTYLHLAASKELTQALRDAGVTAIAYETTEQADGGLPMLTPM